MYTTFDVLGFLIVDIPFSNKACMLVKTFFSNFEKTQCIKTTINTFAFMYLHLFVTFFTSNERHKYAVIDRLDYNTYIKSLNISQSNLK